MLSGQKGSPRKSNLTRLRWLVPTLVSVLIAILVVSTVPKDSLRPSAIRLSYAEIVPEDSSLSAQSELDAPSTQPDIHTSTDRSYDTNSSDQQHLDEHVNDDDEIDATHRSTTTSDNKPIDDHDNDNDVDDNTRTDDGDDNDGTTTTTSSSSSEEDIDSINETTSGDTNESSPIDTTTSKSSTTTKTRSESNNTTIKLHNNDKTVGILVNEDEFHATAYNNETDPRALGMPLNPKGGISTVYSRWPVGHPRFPPTMTFLEALSTCETLDCVRDAHMQPRAGARYNFPHFIIIGWQKSATSSVYAHLSRHAHVMTPSTKEPDFFYKQCRYRISNCSAEDTKTYIKDVLKLNEFVEFGGKKASCEASTHLVRAASRLAPDLYQTFPYTRLILLLREPISRAISMLVHKQDVNGDGCLTQNSMVECLYNFSQIQGEIDYPRALNYSLPLKTWLESYPAGQVHVMQYEELVRSPQIVLKQLKLFLGLHPDSPKNPELPIRNMRKDKLGSDGWKMKREEYEGLIELVKKDALDVAELVNEYGFSRKRRWLSNWEEVWKTNLESCNDEGICNIRVS